MTPWIGQPGRRPRRARIHPDLGPRRTAPARKRSPNGPSRRASRRSATQHPGRRLHQPRHRRRPRADGNQELKGVDVTLPPGMTAKLAGRPLLPARRRSPRPRPAAAPPRRPRRAARRRASSAAPRSPPAAAPQPLHIDAGKAYLAGPYNGAPLSLAVITPATAGPFDLGTVVVRVALFVDPKTAQVSAVTDPIPHVYGGALLDLRAVSVKIDRPQLHAQPDQLPAVARSRRPCTAAAPTRPTRRRSAPSPRQHARSRPPAATRSASGRSSSCAPSAATKRAQEPETEGDPRRPPRRRQHRRAAVTLPKSVILDQAQSRNDLHPGPVRGRTTARRTRSTASPKRRRRCSTGRSKARSTCAPPDTRTAGPASPTCTARSTSSSPVAPTRPTARIRNTFDIGPRRAGLEVRADDPGRQEAGCWSTLANLCAHKQFSQLELNAQNGKQLTKKKLKVRTLLQEAQEERTAPRASGRIDEPVRRVTVRRRWRGGLSRQRSAAWLPRRVRRRAGVAQADTGDIIAPQNTPADAADGWQAGTCTVEPCYARNAASRRSSSPRRPATRRSASPSSSSRTQRPLGTETPVGVLKDVRVDLPVGLSVNPQATPQCDAGDLRSRTRRPARRLGGREQR